MLSFATIVYSKDLPLLLLQALSLARFADPTAIASIHVVMNDVNEAALRSRIAPILDAYGPLRSKVEVLAGDDVLLGPGHAARRTIRDKVLIENRFRIPFARKGGWRGNNGYRTQQALKLGVARVAKAENLVILDTKNVFLRPLSTTDFFTDAGQARVRFTDVNRDNHRAWLSQSVDALGGQYPETDDLQTTVFTTPFAVRRSLVLAVLDEINARYGSVQSLFSSRRRPSEFMLLNAYCMKSPKGYAPWFENTPSPNIGLWPTFSPQKLTQSVERLRAPEVLCLGLHNRAISKLPPDLLDQVFEALETRGICDRKTAEDALNETSALSV